MLYNTLFILSYFYCLCVLICRIASLKMLERFHLCILNQSCVCVGLAETCRTPTRVPPSVLFHFPSLRWKQWKQNWTIFFHVLTPQYVKAFHSIRKANSCNPCTLLHACPELTYSILISHNKEVTSSPHTIVKLPVATKQKKFLYPVNLRESCAVYLEKSVGISRQLGLNFVLHLDWKTTGRV